MLTFATRYTSSRAWPNIIYVFVAMIGCPSTSSGARGKREQEIDRQENIDVAAEKFNLRGQSVQGFCRGKSACRFRRIYLVPLVARGWGSLRIVAKVPL